SNPGIEDVYDTPGFWAIGSGSHMALSMLFYRQQSVITDLAHTIYNVCEAKFMAESASGVGTQTFLHVSTPYGTAPCGSEETTKMRPLWERGGRPKIPKKALSRLEE